MKWICKYCNQEFDFKSAHTKSGHLARCKDWKIWKKKNLTKENLQKLYVEENKSLPEIADFYGLESCTSIDKQLKKFGIKTRNINQAFLISNEKRKKTNIERYGADCIMYRNHPKRLQIQADILEKYGVVNVFQSEEIKEKIKQTCLKKYGFEFFSQVPEIKEKAKVTFAERYNVTSPLELTKINGYNFTKPHKKVVEIIKELGFDCKIEKYLEFENKKYFFDIWFEDKPHMIEVNGDYYHANPEKYKSNDFIPIKKKFAYEIWQDDQLKIDRAKRAGHPILVIWEKEIKKSLEKIKIKIMEFLTCKLE